jgi:hypothetical protein
MSILRFAHDHSHRPVLVPATLAALPSTRAIETRSLPTSLAATHRGFAFYVAFPESSIPDRMCSMSLIPLTLSLPLSRPLGSSHLCRGCPALSIPVHVVRSRELH